MTGLLSWGGETLIASSLLMLFVLAIRGPARRWTGARLGYCLWALPAVRMIMPRLPANWLASFWGGQTSGIGVPFMFAGPRGAFGASGGSGLPSTGVTLLAIWLVGAVALLGIQAGRHFMFCARLRRDSIDVGLAGTARVIATDVRGPLAFGVARRFIAVPRGFLRDYGAAERDLVLAHEAAHHARGDLVANWAALLMLAAHWWNPCAWVAIRAFREDQEFAADAHVLAAAGPDARPVYARVLAKAAGISALPASNLNAHTNLKGRLMMLRQKPRSSRHLVLGGFALALLGSAALAATADGPTSAAGKQAVTIGVKPDGAGNFSLIVDGTAVAAGAPLPNGIVLPADFRPAGGCDLRPSAKPWAGVIKGMGGPRSYTVMCASAGAAPVDAVLTEGLASLKTLRAAVAVQESPSFPASERVHALAAIDRSINEVETTLGSKG